MQIVGYETTVGGDDDDAALLVARDGALQRETLTAGTELSFTLLERHCAGTIDEAMHTPCEREQAPYCDQHTSRWACARCTGECDLPLPSCTEEHAVYLAAFAPATFKVGVTRSWRLETRLREQGADRAAHLRTVADGRVARQIEADIATDVGDRVRVAAKRRGLHQRVDEDAWEALLADFTPVSTYSFDYGLALSERPVAETLATGSVRGTQGRLLVLETNGSTYAVDMRDLVGYEVEPGGTDRQLQSSLGAFR
ncbi:DUF2797 domain-containing protein [Salinibaculum rarum]|uniref:DUF2797 domain-containing protein n=1 Tax=Salinibaculum rarum TaxID=3058903 RepID=UPI00265DC782|nr:DUF2797 domain-containing protein [Salinibaculum sp. KK48]